MARLIIQVSFDLKTCLKGVESAGWVTVVDTQMGGDNPSLEHKVLASITDVVLKCARLDDLLRALVTRLQGSLAVDTAAILLRENGVLVARAAVGLEEEVERGVRIPMGQGFAGRIAAQRQPVIVEDIDHAEVVNPLLREKGLKSIAGVPLLADDGAVRGVLHVGSRRSRKFEPHDTRLLQRVAEQAALAIEHARTREADRRRIASLEALNEVVTTVHAAVRIEPVMQAIADVAQRLSGGGQAFAGFFRGRGEATPTEYRLWEVAGAPRAIFEHLDHLHITPLFAPTFEGRGTVRSDDIRSHPLFRGLPEGHIAVRSYLAVPVMLQRGQVLGAILLGHPEPGRFDQETQQHVESLARHAALALEKALLYERERTTAETLQRSLLPQALPSIAGLAMAARYLPGAAGAEVGGDWYDALSLGHGRVALTIGDVVGHGVPAAAAMSQIHNALRAYALEGTGPAAAMARLNAFALNLQLPTRMTTLVHAVLDTFTWTLTYANAGHLPPLLISPNGGGTRLEGGRSLPLGIDAAAVFRDDAAGLIPGAVLVFYTDGLVEQRSRPLEHGLARLQEVASRVIEAPIDTFADTLLQELVPDGGPGDDVAILALRAISLRGQTLQLDVPADAEALAGMRHGVRKWLQDWAVPADDTYKIVAALGEAAMNATEHAYGPGEATFQVRGEIREGRVWLTIRDTGVWRAARSGTRGRGFTIMQGLMDTVDVDRTSTGTILRMSRRISAETVP